MSKELNKALDLLREIRPSIPKDVLELWCKDRDALLASHPAPAEQAGGDERAAFEAWLAQAMSKRFEPEFDLAKYEDSGEYRYSPATDYWKAWQARAALAQTSSVQELDFSKPLETENGDPVKWICADVIEYKSARVCVAKDTGLVYSSPYIGLKIRNVMPEQAEAERPDVVGYRSGTSGGIYADGYGLEKPEPLMTVAQHERIAASRWERAMDLMGEHVARISEKLKAELEAKLSDPTAVHQWQFSNAWFDGSEDVVLKASKEGSPIRTLYTAPAQAQHSVPEEFSFEYRHPNGECHTVTVSREQVINEMPDFLFEALCSKFCNCEPVGETNVVECCCDEYAEEFKLIAAAPGKEGV
ncbi:hypothetical protein ACQRUU_005454 [Pseudomonas aeruginosa]